MDHTPKILVFDSGVGGLSILLEIRQQLPFCNYVYACDNEAFPYGTKNEDDLLHRVDTVLKVLIREVKPDVIVVACNTASTVVLPRIRSHFEKPVVGVVPAIKPAALLSSTKVIGLLGTPGTVARHYTSQLINEFASQCTVVKVGSSELVEQAEKKLRGETVDKQQLLDIVSPLFTEQALDTIVLACTHFPLLLDELQSIAPRKIRWIDSADAIARRVGSLLPGLSSKQHTQTAVPDFYCLVTANHKENDALLQQLTPLGCQQISLLTL